MLIVTFVSKTPLTTAGAPDGVSVWSYRVESNSPGASGAGELSAGVKIALGLPSGVDAHGPELYPGVDALAGITLQRDPTASRLYVLRQITTPGTQTISFAAPSTESSYELLLARAPQAQPLAPVQFLAGPTGNPQTAQIMKAPLADPSPVFSGRPPEVFAGTLPYASEAFGLYQPLVGWFGQQSVLRAAQGMPDQGRPALDRESFSGPAARALTDEKLATLVKGLDLPVQGVLSPVGLVNLFREYFFEFDTFLGPPAGHLWISPGGTVEVIEVSTRRVLVEKTAEASEEVSRKAEESLTNQDDVADAVKEDNTNDSTLGVSATGGVSTPVYHADASLSLGLHNTVHTSSEQTHKHSRTQSAKVTSEIKRNYKTTFKTVTETTDTTSRRYVVQNTTNELVNYELRRKMRKVGIQLQHIGTRLCWQVYLPDPGRTLGLGELVRTVTAPDLSGLKEPQPPSPLPRKTSPFTAPFAIRKNPTDNNPIPVNEDFFGNPSEDREFIESYNHVNHMFATAEFTAPPPESGYTLAQAAVVSAKSGSGDCQYVGHTKVLNPATGKFRVVTDFANSGDGRIINITFDLTWDPPDVNPAQAEYVREKAAYDKQVAELQQESYSTALRESVKLASSMRPRPSEDLRREERQTVYGNLIHKLDLFADPHLGSEVIGQVFDVEEMLYFVAPDFWRPSAVDAKAGSGSRGIGSERLTASGPRVNYPVTEDSQPAPMGSSLGWLIQIDGDERRNEFLNCAWVKAVMPVRPGKETEALTWLATAHVEGEAGLDRPYAVRDGDPGTYANKTYRQVLDLLAAEVQTANRQLANTVASERVFESGFDPLSGGFRPAEPYQVFDQWVEVLPTDQIVAVEVTYDPKTGRQL